jgi:hypothetical protein
MFGNFEVVKYLVEKGADVDKEYMFDDPIDVAKRYTEKNKKILPYLLQKKGEITGYLVPQEPILNTGK